MAGLVNYVWSSWTGDTYGTTASTTTDTFVTDGYDYSGTASCSTDTFWTKSVQIVYTTQGEETNQTKDSEGTISGYIHADSNTVWSSWVQTSIYDAKTGEYREETNEDRAERQAEVDRRMREQEERALKLSKSKSEAEDTAKGLLLDIIGRKELDVYEETGRLFVKGRKHDYIIQKGELLQILEKDKVTDMCIHLKNNYKYPPTDNVIALLLALINEEDMVLNLGNLHSPRSRPSKLPKYARAA
jgi:hypothetical protein